MPGFTTRIHHWIVRHKIISITVAVLLIVVIGVTSVAFFFNKKPATAPEVPKSTRTIKPPKPVVYYSPLTGQKVIDAATTQAPVTAIMIENSPSARPQSGLKDAGIVYEAIAEGGITRFLALYQESKPSIIGPVRSLRMYFVDWLASYNASIAHVGGSSEALREVRSGSYRDIDQFFNGSSYWRASDRYAPHNVYTSFENLDALNESKGYTSSSFTGFRRADGRPSEEPNATNISINFSSPMYNTSYIYNKEDNSYARSEGGTPHIDRESGQITPTVIVAIKVHMRLVMEDGYREQIDTIGSGDAVIFQNGIAQEAVWHKPSRNAPLSLTDENGAEIPLVRGQTWIAAVPIQGGGISWQ